MKKLLFIIFLIVFSFAITANAKKPKEKIVWPKAVCADAQRRHCAQWISAHGHSFYAEMCSFQRDRRRKKCKI